MRLSFGASSWGLPLVLVGLLAGPAPVLGNCSVGQIAELPVTMRGYRPLVSVKINGGDALMLADSGAFYSMLTAPTAAQFNLPLKRAPIERVTGFGGAGTSVNMTTVKALGIGGAVVPNVEFLVGGTESDSGSVGIVGQNILGFADTEYDFANGVIRLLRPSTDCRKSPLAYWARDQAVATVDIESLAQARFHTIGTAQINGMNIRVLFDSGAGISILTLGAAKRAGIRIDDPGVIPAGAGYGIGGKLYREWIAPVPSFAIGGEEIRNTKLRIADIPSVLDADMVLGPDFFLSHRIYVSNQQHKLYFTYNGGPVFNLNVAPTPTATPAKDAAEHPIEPASNDSTAAAATGTAGATEMSATLTPAEVDALSRSAMAAASRHDYEHALTELSEACKLAPHEPQYLYERATIYVALSKPDLASADLDAALLLKPDYPEALLLRADLHLEKKEANAATLNLDAADAVLPKESEYRFSMSYSYSRARQLPAAIRQLNLWIPAHEKDVKLPQALSSRCWTNALLGQDLEAARADCNSAVSADSKSSRFLEARGLVDLRLGDYKKSVADFDAALKINPKLAWSLYIRGIAKSRLGKPTEGQADIDAAVALSPTIAADTAKYGLIP